ncbi:polysaccharide deacetylase family protein [Niallia sp. 03133]|uniref:polysaccharide deacetylase family protein n=1 Tax=Niallia sp. 03133 TaxID=3458060 RepID=UPI00404478F2
MRKMIPLICILLISWVIVNNPLSNTYVDRLKEKNVAVGANKNALYEEINEKANDYRIEPEDAKIDPVWKAIPGINGLEVDVDASYKSMKASGKFNEKKLVFKQLKPSIHLKDLPPTPIYKGNPNKQTVSFIINVAWGNEYLPDILAVLKKHHVKASFFLEGRWTQKNPELAKMIVEAGNEVGNHSYTHPDMSKISPQQARNEMIKTNDVIKATTGKKITWFAPPSGSYNNDTVQIANENKMGTLMWSIDTVDWRKPAPDVLIQRVVGKVHNGAMILMHPTASTTSALQELIEQIQAKGLEINTVSEMLSEERNVVNSK